MKMIVTITLMFENDYDYCDDRNDDKECYKECYRKHRGQQKRNGIRRKQFSSNSTMMRRDDNDNTTARTTTTRTTTTRTANQAATTTRAAAIASTTRNASHWLSRHRKKYLPHRKSLGTMIDLLSTSFYEKRISRC